MKAMWAVVASLWLAGAASAAEFDPALVDAAKKEGTAVWYTGLIVNQISRPMAEAFEQRFPGIKVQYSRASNTDTTVKLLNEARARRVLADVVDVTSGIHSLTDANLLASYKANSVARYPDELKDQNGRWTASNLYFLAVAYNSDKVKEPPKSFDDLLDPKWKGKMAWTSELAVQGAPGFVHNILTLMGEQKGRDYLGRLANQQPESVAASPRAVLDQVISGEYEIGLMMYNHHVAISAGQGAPVKAAPIEPLVALFSMIGILKDAPHPNAGRLLLEFILSDEGQKVMADHDYLPADPTVPARIATLKPDAGHFAVRYISPDATRDGLNNWISIYRETFR